MTDLIRYGDAPRLTAITCYGVDPAGGGRCGRTYNSRSNNILDRARAAGWRIGTLADGTPDAMCPDCGRPDRATVTLCRELRRSIR